MVKARNEVGVSISDRKFRIMKNRNQSDYTR